MRSDRHREDNVLVSTGGSYTVADYVTHVKALGGDVITIPTTRRSSITISRNCCGSDTGTVIVNATDIDGSTSLVIPEGTVSYTLEWVGTRFSIVSSYVLSFAYFIPLTITTTAPSQTQNMVVTTTGANYTVDWGDTVITDYVSGSTASHIYATAGTYNAKLYTTSCNRTKDIASLVLDTNNAATLTWSNGPKFATSWNFQGGGTSGGSTSSLPTSLLSLISRVSGTYTGDVVNLPRELTFLQVWGTNQITGDIQDLPRKLTELEFTGSSSLTGNLEHIPRTCLDFFLSTNSTASKVRGDVLYLPPSLQRFHITGSNIVTGDVNNIPKSCTDITIEGSNTLSGNILNMPTSTTNFIVSGNNTLSGNITDIPNTVTTFSVGGSNTITGATGDVHSGCSYFALSGSGSVTGNLNALPATLSFFQLTGTNKVLSGDIANLPAGLTYFQVPSNTVGLTYTFPKTWPSNMRLVLYSPASSGLTATEVDNLLIDLAVPTWDTSIKQITLRGANATRTSASDAAVATLITKGVTLDLN